jgi:hypothetical protein
VTNNRAPWFAQEDAMRLKFAKYDLDGDGYLSDEEVRDTQTHSTALHCCCGHGVFEHAAAAGRGDDGQAGLQPRAPLPPTRISKLIS